MEDASEKRRKREEDGSKHPERHRDADSTVTDSFGRRPREHGRHGGRGRF